MRILFHKIDDRRHRLEVVRDSGEREAVTCETRSLLAHDLLHYAVEAEAGLSDGVWGRLRAGERLATLGQQPAADNDGSLAMIETITGALTSAAKGAAPEALVARLADNADALPFPLPAWLTADFVRVVQARMRALMGHYRATPRGASMELVWPPE